MFDVSWGEIGVLVGIGLFVIGKQDMPRACRVAGVQLGRVVGLLQGTKARAELYASQNELHQLQQELRTGLHQLDVIKSELAMSMSPTIRSGAAVGAGAAVGVGSGGIGNNATTTTKSGMVSMTATRTQKGQQQQILSGSVAPSSATLATAAVPAGQQTSLPSYVRSLPPASQTVAAVAEEEWIKRGISYRSRAEQGVGMMNQQLAQEPQQQQQRQDIAAILRGGGDNGSGGNNNSNGSVMLSNLIQQTLLFDQYDRVVKDQDDVIQSKIADKITSVQQQEQERDQRQEHGEGHDTSEIEEQKRQ